MDVNLNDAESQFDGSRAYIDHSYKLLSSRDTLNDRDFGNIKIGHVFTSETKSYQFTQGTNTTAIFGNSNATSATNRDAISKIVDNELNLEFN